MPATPSLPVHKQDIRALTGLRGVAALWVMTYHYRTYPTSFTNPLNAITGRGYLAVDIFFILSGFVMALSYAHMFSGSITRAKFGTFMVRRIARVYPLYLAVTVVIYAGTMLGYGDNAIRDLHWWQVIANLFLIQGWGLSPSIDDPSWSISAELAAYLLFPVLITIAMSEKVGAAVILGLVAGGVLLAAMMLVPGYRGPLDIYSYVDGVTFLRCIPEFCLGLLVFRLARSTIGKKLSASQSFALFAGLGFVIVTGSRGSDAMAIVFAATLVLVLSGRNCVAALAGSRFPFYLGEISYAMYLIHSQLMRVKRNGHEHLDSLFGPRLAGEMSALMFVLLTMMFATLAYRYLEKPARSLLRRAETSFDHGAGRHVAESERAGSGDLQSSRTA